MLNKVKCCFGNLVGVLKTKWREDRNTCLGLFYAALSLGSLYLVMSYSDWFIIPAIFFVILPTFPL